MECRERQPWRAKRFSSAPTLFSPASLFRQESQPVGRRRSCETTRSIRPTTPDLSSRSRRVSPGRLATGRRSASKAAASGGFQPQLDLANQGVVSLRELQGVAQTEAMEYAAELVKTLRVYDSVQQNVRPLDRFDLQPAPTVFDLVAVSGRRPRTPPFRTKCRVTAEASRQPRRTPHTLLPASTHSGSSFWPSSAMSTREV